MAFTVSKGPTGEEQQCGKFREQLLPFRLRSPDGQILLAGKNPGCDRTDNNDSCQQYEDVRKFEFFLLFSFLYP